MKCLIYKELGVVESGNAPDPTYPVWIKVKASGICGTDVKAVYKGHKYFKPPTILGHELYGQIYKTAEGFGLEEGTWVVAAPYYECGECDFCKAGKGDLCRNKHYLEGGAFAEYIGVPLGYEDGLFPLPPVKDTSEYDVYALTEPLSCVINGVERLETIPDYSNVLVVGGGPMGALFALYYKQIGIDVAVVEPSKERREQLESFGIKTREFDSVKKGEFDNVVIAVNIPELVPQYMPLIREGGNLLVFSGLPSGVSLSVDASCVHYSEISVKGCSGFGLRQFKKAFEMIKADPALYRKLITHRLPFEEGQKAFDLLKSGKAFKILLGSDL